MKDRDGHARDGYQFIIQPVKPHALVAGVSSLQEIGYDNVDMSLIEAYSEPVNSDNTYKMLSQCISNLNNLVIKVADIEIELVDNPQIQCCKPR